MRASPTPSSPAPAPQAIAAVPWTPNTPEGVAWRNHVALGVATLQEQDSWKIKRSVDLIWAGASEAEVLAGAIGLDPASREAVKMILFHVRKVEKERGPPEGRPPRPRAEGAPGEAAAAAAADAGSDEAGGATGSVSEVLITSEGIDDDEGEEDDEEEREASSEGGARLKGSRASGVDNAAAERVDAAAGVHRRAAAAAAGASSSP